MNFNNKQFLKYSQKFDLFVYAGYWNRKKNTVRFLFYQIFQLLNFHKKITLHTYFKTVLKNNLLTQIFISFLSCHTLPISFNAITAKTFIFMNENVHFPPVDVVSFVWRNIFVQCGLVILLSQRFRSKFRVTSLLFKKIAMNFFTLCNSVLRALFLALTIIFNYRM